MGIDFRNGITQKYIGLAKNNEGFRSLNEHLTSHLQEKTEFGDAAPELENTFIIYPFKAKTSGYLKENEFIGIKPAELVNLSFSEWRKSSRKTCNSAAINLQEQARLQYSPVIARHGKQYFIEPASLDRTGFSR